MLPIGFLSAIMGIAAKAAYPDISATLALPKIIMSLNPLLAGVTLAALWAADVSTACNLLLGTSTLFSQDIFKRYIKPDIDENTFSLVTKLTVVVIGVLTFILASSVVGILKTLLVALSLTTAFTLTMLFTIFKPSMCRKSSASATIIAGIITLIVWQMVPEVRIFSHPIYMEWIVCTVVFFGVMILDKRKITKINEKEMVKNA